MTKIQLMITIVFFIMIKLSMLFCGFRMCSFVDSCSEKHKKCVWAGYLKGVNSVQAFQEDHLLFWHIFSQYRSFTMFTNILILIIYFENGMYYLVIISLKGSLIGD